MEKNLRIALLFDVYGEFITPRQRSIVSAYYEYDHSLAEIAENLSITRQAAHDALKSAEKSLMRFEEKLKLLGIKEKLLHADSLEANETKQIISELVKTF